MKFSPRKRIKVYLVLLLLLVVVLGGCITQPVLFSQPRSSMSVDPKKLEAHVKKLSVDYSPRSYRDKDNLKKCAVYIKDELARAGAEVSFQEYDTGSTVYRNVIGRFGSATGKVIVVGAHYDACGDTPGADDNASGIAGLIELAKLLGGSNTLGCAVELVAYCTEEPPFYGTEYMGSYKHAEYLSRQGRDVVGMIALEMLGYYTDRFWSQKYPVGLLYIYYPWRGNFIAVVGNTDQRHMLRRVKSCMKGTTELPIWSACVPKIVPGIDFSDHRNYWKFGYPAVMVTDTAFYRNTEYHEMNDTYDRLDYQKMAWAVVSVYEAVRMMSFD